MNSVPARIGLALVVAAVWFGDHSVADAEPLHDTHASRAGARSLSRDRLEWPSWEDVTRTLLLRDYNTRIVTIGTTTLGVAAGIVEAHPA